jgi:NAD(P)-dependent dehydrogenase (short-subunit alcohol dehydrogenase family)
MRLHFSGRHAVVTGGANGIGAAIAAALAQCGARVSVFDREASPYTVDVSDPAALAAAFDAVPTPDAVFINAGVVLPRPLLETTREEWDRTLAVNLSGAFHTLQLAARRMRGRGGAIVLTASTNSYDGEPDLTAYNASKAGLLGLLHTTANELGRYGIRVNAVCPGLINTRLTAGHFGDPELMKNYFRHLPLGRGGQPAEVAAAALFLASGLASYITGATLFVDGGQMASKFGVWNEPADVFVNDHWEIAK